MPLSLERIHYLVAKEANYVVFQLFYARTALWDLVFTNSLHPYFKQARITHFKLKLSSV